MSKNSATVIKDGQLAVATVPQTGTLVGAASEIDATALVETADGLQLCVKTCEVGGGGGGGGTVDQTYDPTSTNAQSGTAVAEAVAPALKNTATGTNALTILGISATGQGSINIGKSANTLGGTFCTALGNTSIASGSLSTAIGTNANATGYYSVAIGGQSVFAKEQYAIAIGTGMGSDIVKANARHAIQLGQGTNSTANSFQVFNYQMLDGTTGLIPAARIGTGYDATKTQVLKNVNGTLTWVDE